MKVAIQQPHYFPWVGYFDKMAKADCFVLMDSVQLEKRSNMLRNRVIDPNGNMKFISIQGNYHGYQHMEYRQMPTVNIEEWTTEHLNVLKNYYKDAPYIEEIIPILNQFYCGEYATVCEWTCASIWLIRDILEVTTPLIYQSDLAYDRAQKKSDLILELCKASHANFYLSGRGASVEYLNREKFVENNIKIVFQDFTHPIYPQIHTPEFVPGISILDMLFNCGIEESRRIFWENVRSTHEFD